VSLFVAATSAAVMVVFATAMYNLQWRLERSDYERHFED
jgi:hypothetical protein